MEVSNEEVIAEIAGLQQEAAAQQAAEQAAGPAPASPGANVATSYQEPTADDLSWQEVIQPLLLGGFSVLAPAWDITGAECQQLADVYAPLCEKYFPEGPGKWGPEIAATFVTVTIITPRLGKPRKLPKPGENGDNWDKASNEAESGWDNAGTNGTETPPTDKKSDDVEVSAADIAGLDA